MSENNQIKVVFHTLKKHYTIHEKVVPSFTIYGFIPSSTSDWIGIFNSTDSSVDNVFSWKYVSTLNLEEDSDTDFTSSVNLDVSFTPVQEISYELRYISDKKTYGRSATFQISAIAPKESFIAVKEGASFDEDLILVDKISYGGIKKAEDDVAKLSQDLQEKQLNLQMLQEELDSTVNDKELSNKLLDDEVLRRKKAESAVEELARKLGEQMTVIDNQSKDVNKLKNDVDRVQSINESLKEECEIFEESVKELDDVKIIAQNYKNEYSKLSLDYERTEMKMETMAERFLEDRENYSEELVEMKETATEEIVILKKIVEELETKLAKENSNENKSKEDLDNLKEKHEAELKSLKEELANKDTLLEKVKVELQAVIDDKQKQISALEVTVTELESRVCNESNNASRLENDLIIADNRVKDATEDIKYFRLKFLEAEQMIQQKQSLLSKYLEELNNMKNVCKTDRAIDRYDDKSDVSACNSNETIAESRLRTDGDVTDFTDDEGENTRSIEAIIKPAFNNKQTPNIMSIDPETLQRTVPPFSGPSYLQPISVIGGTKSRRCYGKPIDLKEVASNAAKTADYTSFTKDVSQLERVVLEKQYTAIRQHRNSLIRENTFLKNKVQTLNHDIMVMNRNIQTSMGMVASSMYTSPPRDSSSSYNTNGSLSPYATEYKPNTINNINPSLLPTPMFIPPIGMPPPPAGFFEFMAAHAQYADPGYTMLLPPTPLPHNQLQADTRLVDVTDQLNGMGINISKNH